MDLQIAQTILPAGRNLNGSKYTIINKIGEGGFSITYRARQNDLNRMVCIKEYFLYGRCVRDLRNFSVTCQPSDNALFQKYRKAFVDEAHTVTGLDHPNIVKVIDIFDENNTSYMVMPFIEGQTLDLIVSSRGAMSFNDAINYIAQVAVAVDYIHRRHILHRDIKPSNIIITPDNKAVLIDFGSAREFVNDKTQAHTSILTHGYAPPEQYSTVSHKGEYSDIYSLAATLYYILTAKPPVDAAARLAETLVEPRQLNSSVPVDANRAIMKALNLQTSQRQQSVNEFLTDLHIPLNQLTAILPGDSPLLVPPKQAAKRHFNIWIVVAAVLLVAGVVTFLVLHSKLDDEKSHVNRLYSENERLERNLNIYSNQSSDYSSQLRYARDSIKSQSDLLTRMINKYPMIVTKGEFANVDSYGYTIDSYGSTMYRSRINQIKPRITYKGFKSGDVYLTVRCHYYRDNYSYYSSTSKTVTINMDDNNTVEMDSMKPYPDWDYGYYYFEIWCNSVCIARYSVYIN